MGIPRRNGRARSASAPFPIRIGIDGFGARSSGAWNPPVVWQNKILETDGVPDSVDLSPGTIFNLHRSQASFQLLEQRIPQSPQEQQPKKLL